MKEGYFGPLGTPDEEPLTEEDARIRMKFMSAKAIIYVSGPEVGHDLRFARDRLNGLKREYDSGNMTNENIDFISTRSPTEILWDLYKKDKPEGCPWNLQRLFNEQVRYTHLGMK